MRIAFIYPDITAKPNWKGYYYIGIGSLSAVLKQNGHEVVLVHIFQQKTKEEFFELIDGIDADLFAFSSTTNMFFYIEKWVKWLKERLDTRIIVGGVHPTLCPEEVISTGQIDMICIGEGEGAMLELCDKLENDCDIRKIRNIWFRDDKEIYRNSVRPLIKNLDILPYPDREIFDLRNIGPANNGTGLFMASRGCPFNCSYCCNHALKKICDNPSNYVRFKSVDYLLDEIEYALRKYDFIDSLHFDDDIFPLKRKWLKDFTHRYQNRINLPFSCNLRVDLANENTITLLKSAGCFNIGLGIESGNEYVRNKILKRNISKRQIINAFSFCESADISTSSFNMIGIPFEDPLKILETVKLNAKVKPNHVQVSIFYPYPKTDLYNLCEENGFLSPKESISYFEDSMLNLESLSNHQILFFRYYFQLFVRLYSVLFLFPKNISKICDYILGSKIVSRLFFRHLNSTYVILRKINNILIKR